METSGWESQSKQVRLERAERLLREGLETWAIVERAGLSLHQVRRLRQKLGLNPEHEDNEEGLENMSKRKQTESQSEFTETKQVPQGTNQTLEAVGMAPAPGGGYVAYKVQVPADHPGVEVLGPITRGEMKARAISRLKLALVQTFLLPPKRSSAHG